MNRRALICAGVLPVALPVAAAAFGRDPRPGPDGCLTPDAWRAAHARHPLAPEARKMMEEGAICPICGCPPGLAAKPKL